MYFDEQYIILLNRKFVNAEQSNTNLYSQTLHYDYGDFEEIRTYYTLNWVKIFKVKEHYERLIVQTSKLLKINNFNLIYALKCIPYFCEKMLNICVSSYFRLLPRTTQIQAYACGNYVNSILTSSKTKFITTKDLLNTNSDFFRGTTSENIGFNSLNHKIFSLNWKKSLGLKITNHL